MKHDKFDLVARNNGYEPLGLFSPFFDDFFDVAMFSRKEMNRFNNMMKTDVKEGEHSYTLDIEMPGIDKKDIALDLKDGYLTVSARREHRQENEDKKENFIRRERSYGEFTRSFYVGDVKKEEIEASLENGVLKVVVPKEPKKVEGSNRIEIK